MFRSQYSIFLLEARRVTVRADRAALHMRLEDPPRSVPSHRLRVVARGVYHQISHFFCLKPGRRCVWRQLPRPSAEMRREPPAAVGIIRQTPHPGLTTDPKKV